MLTHEEFIRKLYPNWKWFEEKNSPGDIIAMNLSDLYYLMDQWTYYQLSQVVDINPTRENLNVGGGGFLEPED